MTISLKPFEAGDIDRLLSWIDSEALMVQWSGPYFTWPLTRPALEAYQRTAFQEPAIRKIHKVVDDSSGDVVGHIELNNLDFRNLSATLSRVLIAPQARGRGICLPMTRAILAVAFDQLYLHRVNLNVYDFNHKAIRCYERAGFRREGFQRHVARVGSEFWDSWSMAILEDEWRALTARQEQA